jgi:putative membrane protein
MELKLEWLLHALLSSAVFTALGLTLFVIAYFLVQKLLPFSIRKEIEEDHNTALAIVMGSIVIAIALIISAAVHG